MPPQQQLGATAPASVQSPRGQGPQRNLFSLHGVDVGLVTGQATRRPLEELLTALRKGEDLLKHGRHGKPKMHYFRLVDQDARLSWRSAKGVIRTVPLQAVLHIKPGQQTDTFKKHLMPAAAARSFSLVYTAEKEGTPRTLDLTCQTHQDFELWFCGLQAVLDHLRAAKVPPIQPPKSLGGMAMRESMQRQPSPQQGIPLTSPRDSLQAPLAGSQEIFGGGVAQGRVTGVMGVPVVPHNPGDCFMWGQAAASSSIPGTLLARNKAPVLVPNTTHLDICEVATGSGHAVMLTSAGDVYAWGCGNGGRLGLGHSLDAYAPQRLHTLWEQPVKHLAACDGASAAITADGSLWTWGDNASGALGHESTLRQFIPRRVEFAAGDAVVVQVACGPYHMAVVTASGGLYTCGDGLAGKLGHGSFANEPTPRQVMGLAAMRVLSCACGVWHTAAVVQERPDGGAEALSQLTYLEGRHLQAKMADMYDMVDEDGGVLYTWGGVGGACVSDAPPQQPARKEDSNKGCLGLGDTTGRKLPTRVGGELASRSVRHVGAGLNLTVAVTTEATVWQMGTTGASAKGGAAAPWEGAVWPTQVGGDMEGARVQHVSVGLQHVAALAVSTQMRQLPGRAQARERASALWMWGRGKEGQLGQGSLEDCALPCLVPALKARAVLQVVCSGCHTMAVVAHDAEAEDTEERRRGYKAKLKSLFTTGGAGSTSGRLEGPQQLPPGIPLAAAPRLYRENSSPLPSEPVSPHPGSLSDRSGGLQRGFPPMPHAVLRNSGAPLGSGQAFSVPRGPQRLVDNLRRSTPLARRLSGSSFLNSQNAHALARTNSSSSTLDFLGRQIDFERGISNHSTADSELDMPRDSSASELGLRQDSTRQDHLQLPPLAHTGSLDSPRLPPHSKPARTRLSLITDQEAMGPPEGLAESPRSISVRSRLPSLPISSPLRHRPRGISLQDQSLRGHESPKPMGKTPRHTIGPGVWNQELDGLAGHAVGGADTPPEVSPVKGYSEGTGHHHRTHSNALRTMLHHVLTHTASQVPSLGGSPHSPSSLAGHSEAELERELADLKNEAGRLQHRLADIQRRQAEINSHLRQAPLLATFRESEEVQGDPPGDTGDTSGPISRRSSHGGEPPLQWSPRSSPTRSPLRSPSKLSRTPMKLTRETEDALAATTRRGSWDTSQQAEQPGAGSAAQQPLPGPASSHEINVELSPTTSPFAGAGEERRGSGDVLEGGIKPSLATSITAATMGDSAWDGTPRQSAWGGPPVGDGAEPGLQDTRERITTAPGVVITLEREHPGGPQQLVKVQFDEAAYSSASAAAWWAANKGALELKYCFARKVKGWPSRPQSEAQEALPDPLPRTAPHAPASPGKPRGRLLDDSYQGVGTIAALPAASRAEPSAHKRGPSRSMPAAPKRPSGWGASLVDPMPGRMSGAGKHSSELETNPTAPPYQDLAGPLLQRTHSQFAAQLERALHSSFKEPSATLQSRDTAWDLGGVPESTHPVEVQDEEGAEDGPLSRSEYEDSAPRHRRQRSGSRPSHEVGARPRHRRSHSGHSIRGGTTSTSVHSRKASSGGSQGALSASVTPRSEPLGLRDEDALLQASQRRQRSHPDKEPKGWTPREASSTLRDTSSAYSKHPQPDRRAAPSRSSSKRYSEGFASPGAFQGLSQTQRSQRGSPSGGFSRASSSKMSPAFLDATGVREQSTDLTRRQTREQADR